MAARESGSSNRLSGGMCERLLESLAEAVATGNVEHVLDELALCKKHALKRSLARKLYEVTAATDAKQADVLLHATARRGNADLLLAMATDEDNVPPSLTIQLDPFIPPLLDAWKTGLGSGVDHQALGAMQLTAESRKHIVGFIPSLDIKTSFAVIRANQELAKLVSADQWRGHFSQLLANYSAGDVFHTCCSMRFLQDKAINILLEEIKRCHSGYFASAVAVALKKDLKLPTLVLPPGVQVVTVCDEASLDLARSVLASTTIVGLDQV